MADQPLTKQKKEARKKGYAALGSVALTTLFTLMSPYFLLPGIPASAWFTYRWFKYRAKWGIKF